MHTNQLLYHYCSAQSGFSILKNRTFRLSALSAANDSLEGRLLGQVFANLLRASGLSKGVAEVASIIVEGYADSTEGFALCLSEQGDLLSQWRAYARDGSGIAIGFDPKILNADFGQVNFGTQFYELLQVEYGEEGFKGTLAPFVKLLVDEFAQHGEFVVLRDSTSREEALRILGDRKANIGGLFVSQDSSAKSLLTRLLKTLAPLHFRIFGTKPKAFYEEREWRLIRYRHRVSLHEIEYFADEHSVRPFISCLVADPARDVVKEVILGPKHRSNIDWVRAFLASVGMQNVKVRHSNIESYR